jgi:hypothetical protein
MSILDPTIRRAFWTPLSISWTCSAVGFGLTPPSVEDRAAYPPTALQDESFQTNLIYWECDTSDCVCTFTRDFNFPKQPKTISVPAQQRVRLDNLQDLLPIGNPVREEQPPRQPWRYRAPAEDNLFLTQ